MKKRVMLILSCLFLSIGFITAQTTRFTGVVLDDIGEPVVGASVVVKGTTVGTITELDGTFSINVPEGRNTLVFSLVGMQSVEAKASPNMKITLKSDDKMLDEVMVVAYGTVKKGAFTGSASVVNKDMVEKSASISLDKALQGASSGVQVASTSGQPGSSTTVRIRGVGSIGGDSSPLYVIDGVPVSSSANASGADGSSSEFSKVATTFNPLATLNNEDIESITVLKDASAASLYGSRAANGVILITTKKGVEGKTQISFKAQVSVSSLHGGYDLMDGSELYRHYWNGYSTALKNDNLGLSNAEIAQKANQSTQNIFLRNPYNVANPIGADGNLVSDAQLMINTDWMKETYKTAVSQQYDLSVSGGSKTSQYYVGLGYLNQDGIALQSNLERYSGRINVSSKAKEWFSMGINSTFSMSKQKTPSAEGGGSSPIVGAVFTPNLMALYDLDDNFQKQYDASSGKVLYNFQNPIFDKMNGVALAYLDQYKSTTYRALISPWVEVRPIENLAWRTNLGADYTNMDETQWYNRNYGNAAGNIGGRLYKYAIWNLTTTLTSTLSYDYSFKEKHNLNFLAGFEAMNYKYNRTYAQGTNFPVFDLIELNLAGTPTAVGSLTWKENLISYIGRVNYDYASKYYLSLSARRDGSSRFGVNNKYGTFWSIGGSWRVSEESFMSDTKAWLDDFKLRASYGTSGSKDNIGRFASLGLYATGRNYNSVPGIAHSQLPNPDLKWEKAKNFNIGIDFSLFNRLSGTVDYYVKRSSDLLLDRPLAPSTGLDQMAMNIGGLKNSGWEFSLTNVNVASKDFYWSSTFNLSLNSNKIVDYPDDYTVNGSKIWTNGYSVYEFYLKEWAGVDKENGNPQWYKDVEDKNGNVTRELTSDYSAASFYKSGSALPNVFGSLNNTFKYRGFDASFLITYSFGGKVLDQYEYNLLNDGNKSGYQMSREALDSWTPENVDASNPIFIPNNSNNSNGASTRFLHKSDFIKLKNISVGYTLPKSLLSKISVDQLRLFTTIDNLYVWSLDSAFKGWDPEMAGISGVLSNGGAVPLPRTVLFGLSVNF